jgi:hypothetical protein
MFLPFLFMLQAAASTPPPEPGDVLCRSVEMRVAASAHITRPAKICRTRKEWEDGARYREAIIAKNLSRPRAPR